MRTSVVPVVLLLLGGCKGPALVVVHISAASQVDGIATFVGTAAAGSKTVPVQITPAVAPVSIPPESTFGIQLPSSISGQIDVHLTARDATGADIVSGDGAAMISPGGRSDLNLVLGGSSASLDMSASDTDAAGSLLTIAPSTFAFGSAAKSSTGINKAFTVTNGGTAAAGPLGSAAVTGAGGASFSIVGDGCNAMVIAPGSSCTVTLQFAPKVAGVLAGSLEVSGAAAGISGYGVGAWHSETATADLSGTGGGEILLSVWGSGTNDVYAVGTASSSTGIGFHRGASGVWQIATSPSVQKLSGVWGTSATDVFAVGGNVGGGHATVMHSTGSGFSETFMFSQSVANGIFGFGSSNIYLAWSSGTAPPPHSGVWRSTDGVTFAAQPGVAGAGVPPDGMAAVWGSSPTDVYAVGAGVYHSVGDGAWFSQSTATGLTAVAGSAASDVYAVGLAGVLLHSKGDGTWTPQTGPGGDYYGVWSAGPNDVWIVGNNGTAVRSTGDGNWSAPATTPPGVTLRAIWGSSGADIYAVGDAGVILHYY